MNNIPPLNSNNDLNRGMISWFARNDVAANLLMLFILIAGLISLANINMHLLPDSDMPTISVDIIYPGASPEEVEQGVTIKVEEAINGIQGAGRITSSSTEGLSNINIEIGEDADPNQLIDDIRLAVDRLNTLPKQIERPVISRPKEDELIINLSLYGDVSEATLKNLAYDVQYEISALPEVARAQVSGDRPFEVGIEVSEETLRRYGLTFDEVATAVSLNSMDLAGGSLKSDSGQILIRTMGQKYFGNEFEDIVLIASNDGTSVRLGDIATIIDGFEETDVYSRLNRTPTVAINIWRTGGQNTIDVAQAVHEYVEMKKKLLPTGIEMKVWMDVSAILDSRISLLVRNAGMGLFLVLLVLTLFMELRIAFWAAAGIFVAFCGTFALMIVLGATLNMVTIFGFIIVLGIVVDDAIIVGENIHAYREKGFSGQEAAILGVKEMAMPVTLAVITTMVAFTPLYFTEGQMGRFFSQVAIVVIPLLFLSLVEVLLILPAHLGVSKPLAFNGVDERKIGVGTRFKNGLTNGLSALIQGPYRRTIERLITWRYCTLAAGLSIFILCVGVIAGGYVKFVYHDEVDGDEIICAFKLPQGSSHKMTARTAEYIHQQVERLKEVYPQYVEGDKFTLIETISVTVGSQPRTTYRKKGTAFSKNGENMAEIIVQLSNGELRETSTSEVKKAWRKLIGDRPEITEINFSSQLMSPGEPIHYQILHPDFPTLVAAADLFKLRLAKFEGVNDISSSFQEGKRELIVRLKPEGHLLGLNITQLSQQLRQGFYGKEVQRIQRGRHEVKIMVRYPKEERQSIADIENMRLRLPDGKEVSFGAVADITLGRGYSSVERAELNRVIDVIAGVDESVTSGAKINHIIVNELQVEINKQFPGLKWSTQGAANEENKSLSTLKIYALLALLVIYSLLAIQFKSYVQPMLVMSVIPLGLIGAVFGHALLGYDMSISSIFGLVAVSGVVVNDALILIDMVNRYRIEGIVLKKAIVEASCRRFRPIILTTMTTFVGLLPMMIEKSFQAKFLIPMAISLGFGVLAASVITLIMIPALYMVVEDLKQVFSVNRKSENDVVI